ncbi:uncharacterized protein Z518_09548 [Rhinocladiella mackenziei CBS 650.93]|uniref:Rhinocladiella mackenziei CBS 650.93 unplaced genomic scaffold supercont1.7, whole genome shotgun sequence n=1 Tax=Rhinocladiella mackenziei CBS 650.93 TaxID=1442369 RepID=A0A0D2IEY2_9EURO|nr:uncharacterized protein Z518_09548 [Rhinocladiella mackenziei CBS 650.93]KIX01821.1 hypothetical protein Z518_09548 [Rhinocladiella mackenziei CBS 650.93]
MPSLARKSMKFMRDVYNAANSGSDRPPIPSATQSYDFQPTPGLSTQFTQANPPYYNPPSPYIPPNSAHGHPYTPQPTYSVSTPHHSPFQNPQQPPPRGNWSNPLLTTSPPPPLPPHPTSNSTPPLSGPPITSITPGHPFPPISPTSLPASPQQYGPQIPNSQYQHFPQKPPLPERLPHHHSEGLRPNTSQLISYTESQEPVSPMTPAGTSSFNWNQPNSAPPFSNGYHSDNSHSPGVAELPAPRPPPPPLPQRPQTHRPSVSKLSMEPNVPDTQRQDYGTRVGTVSAPPSSTTIWHEMPAEPIVSASPAQNHQTTASNIAELPSSHSPRPSIATSQPSYHEPPAGVVELPNSPVSFSPPQPFNSQQLNSIQGKRPPDPFPLEPNLAAVLPPPNISPQMPQSDSSHHHRDSNTNGISWIQNTSSHVARNPQSNDSPSPTRPVSSPHLSIPRPPSLPPESSSAQPGPFNMNGIVSAVNSTDHGRRSSQSKPSYPVGEVPYPQHDVYPSAVVMPMAHELTGAATSTLPNQNTQPPALWSGVTNHAYPVMGPQSSVSLGPYQDAQSPSSAHSSLTPSLYSASINAKQSVTSSEFSTHHQPRDGTSPNSKQWRQATGPQDPLT